MLDTPTTPDSDHLTLYGKTISSRLLMGTAAYPSPDILRKAIASAHPEIVTLSLRRETAGKKSGEQFYQLIRQLDVDLLPNTAGCETVKEAVATARMARELFQTDWIKLEVIGNPDTLQPDVVSLIEATRILTNDGFRVFPYTTEDLTIAEKLCNAGAEVIMPWGSPIGSGRGLANPYALKTLRSYFPDTPLIIDAGIGAPSHATHAMELGYDAILLNTAISKAEDPVAMAQAFASAIKAGRTAYKAGVMEPRDMASPSTPVAGTPFSF